MKNIIKVLTLIAFVGLNYCHHADAAVPFPVNHAQELKVGVTFPVLDLTISEKTVYYVKIGNTISKLEDKEGYIIAAKRLGMETIQVIPDGKVYKTVSLDLKKDDEALKDAIEVRLDEIIVAN